MSAEEAHADLAKVVNFAHPAKFISNFLPPLSYRSLGSPLAATRSRNFSPREPPVAAIVPAGPPPFVPPLFPLASFVAFSSRARPLAFHRAFPVLL